MTSIYGLFDQDGKCRYVGATQQHTSMGAKKRIKLATDLRGYVAGVRCPNPHSGNRGMAQATYWAQCSGCGRLEYVSDLLRRGAMAAQKGGQ